MQGSSQEGKQTVRQTKIMMIIGAVVGSSSILIERSRVSCFSTDLDEWSCIGVSAGWSRGATARRWWPSSFANKTHNCHSWFSHQWNEEAEKKTWLKFFTCFVIFFCTKRAKRVFFLISKVPPHTDTARFFPLKGVYVPLNTIIGDLVHYHEVLVVIITENCNNTCASLTCTWPIPFDNVVFNTPRRIHNQHTTTTRSRNGENTRANMISCIPLYANMALLSPRLGCNN